LSIYVEWYDAHQTIIVAQVVTGWNWSIAQQARLTVQQLAQSVAYPVALIVVLPSDLSVPPNGFAENSKDALQNHVHAGLVAVIYVTTNAATKSLWQSVIDMYATPTIQYGFAPTLDAAVAMLS
jgi:hypothetical protein